MCISVPFKYTRKGPGESGGFGRGRGSVRFDAFHQYPFRGQVDLCTQRASAGAARPSLGTMLRTTLVPKLHMLPLQPIAGRSAAFPRNNQHLQCWLIKSSALLAVKPASISARKRLRCTEATCQTMHKGGSRHAEDTQTVSSQPPAGSGRRRYHSTVCQASRTSMLDSLEEVRSRQSLNHSLCLLSHHCCSTDGLP